MAKRVLLFKLDNLHAAPRVLRTFQAIKEDYEVTTAGYSPISREESRHIPLNEFKDLQEPVIDFHFKYPYPLRKLFSFFIKIVVLRSYSEDARFERKYWNKKHKAVYGRLSGQRYDIIIAHGIDALPLAARMAGKQGAKLVFNAHEYYPREFEENEAWVREEMPYMTYLCKAYLKKANLIFAVTQSIADEYKNVFGLNSVVITNAASYRDLEPQPVKTPVRIIHHGIASRGRRLEDMIRCVQELDERFTLDLMLVNNDDEYYQELSQLIERDDRIRIIPPVSFHEIVNHINAYDVGLYILPKTNFNNEMALPNKFFEFIQARLMLAISPNHEMAKIVRQYNMGVVSEDYSRENMVQALKKLTETEIYRYKQNAATCAGEINAEKNAEKIRTALDKL